MITFDPNLRLPLWKSQAEAKEEILWGLSKADVVKISDEEVEFLWGAKDPEKGARILLDQYGVKLAMVTLGPDGVYGANKNGSARVSCPSVTPLDTTGAGDIFGGSAISRLLALGKDPNSLQPEEIQDIIAFASTAASLSTEKRGGIPSIPSMEEVLAKL